MHCTGFVRNFSISAGMCVYRPLNRPQVVSDKIMQVVVGVLRLENANLGQKQG
jgi:hypothetical protein